jgi:ABC-type antimicrobial peptide transport system permease subunit
VPVAALMNGAAMGAFGTGPGGIAIVGVDGVLIPLSVRAEIELFPTMQPATGIVVVNYDHFRALTSTVMHFELSEQNELWLDFDEGTSVAEQQAIVTSLTSRSAAIEALPSRPVRLLSERLEEAASDPTLQASGSGILSVAFISVLALSTLGFIVTLVLSARSRTVEFAVLRIVGTSSRQILRSMLIEWGTVLLIGAVVGVLLGRQVARIMLSFLEVTDQGTRVLPPFILETDWVTLGIGIGVLVGLVAVALGLAWATTMRRANASELRITQ